jgi:hypothetical protein
MYQNDVSIIPEYDRSRTRLQSGVFLRSDCKIQPFLYLHETTAHIATNTIITDCSQGSKKQLLGHLFNNIYV